jgi:inorganic phosphate transporter, PiT family
MTALIFVIVLALAFDYINGFHDAANSVATVVSTRVLSPRTAVLWAAFFNFIAFIVFDAKVAKNIAKGLDPTCVSLGLVAAALVGAVAWGLITWYAGLPSSSSHALVGGMAGAAICKSGFGALDLAFFGKTALFIIVSPVLGCLLGALLMQLTMRLFGSKPQRHVDSIFRKGQLISAALYSLGHGGNDAQKTMGIIVMALVASGKLAQGANIPLYVVLACHIAMGLGTLSGGWRIVKTMGMKITKLQPVGGFNAETAGALTLFISSYLGVAVSTTHTITGAIVGVGSARKLSAVRWGIASRIVWAWVLTIPAAALVSAAAYWLIAHAGLR